MMVGFLQNIEQLTLNNTHFRQVIYTGQHAQLVVMSLKPSEEIGVEVHEIVDQFLRVESGEGKVFINKEIHKVKNGDAIIVPAGATHNVVNTSKDKPLKLYTIYSPPHHKDKVTHRTKIDAVKDKEDHL